MIRRALMLVAVLCAVCADKEREVDGAGARIRTHHHRNDEPDEADHQAILGSKHEAEEFDKLSPEESQRRLRVLALRMDADQDGQVSEEELTAWVHRSMKTLDDEEASERLKEIDVDGDEHITWHEYLADSFPDTDIETLDADDRKLMEEDRQYFDAADENNDGRLSESELRAFLNPENYAHMHKVLVDVTLWEKDANRDGAIDLKEFLGDMHEQPQSEWHQVEKDRFYDEYDLDKDGLLRGEEIRKWLIPDLNQVALQEARHLFESADKDRNGMLSIDEIVDDYRVFVGSEATNYGDALEKMHEEL